MKIAGKENNYRPRNSSEQISKQPTFRLIAFNSYQGKYIYKTYSVVSNQ